MLLFVSNLLSMKKFLEKNVPSAVQDLLYSFIIEKSYECWNHLTLKSLWLEIISVLQLYQLNFNISLSFEKLQPPNYGFRLTKQFNNFKVDLKNSPSGFVFPFFFSFLHFRDS